MPEAYLTGWLDGYEKTAPCYVMKWRPQTHASSWKHSKST